MRTRQVASALKKRFLLEKKKIRNMTKMAEIENEIPKVANDFFRESPQVSPCNCFDSSWTGLDEIFFELAFLRILLFSVNFLVLGFGI